MAYVTTAEYQDYMNAMLGGTAAVSDVASTTFVASLLEQATQFVESETKRKFQFWTATRYYNSKAVVYTDPQLLMFDEDLLEITSITNGNGTSLSAGDYWLEPMNKLPSWGIRLKSTKVWSFSTDGIVEVTGKWGYSLTPSEDVKRIVMRLAYVFQQKRTATGDVEIVGNPSQLGGVLKYGSYIPSDIRDWLRRHRRDFYG